MEKTPSLYRKATPDNQVKSNQIISEMAKHEETPIPCFSSLEAVYGDGSQLEEAKLRFDHLNSKFLQVFGHPPDVFARSPGRVNLIGEHIDYEGYSVLPMAIRQDTIIAIRKNHAQKVLRIANVNDKYTECTYPVDPNQAIDLKNHKWGHYFICGYKGFYEFAKSKGVDMGDAVGLDVIVDGTVPTGSGLSSSAAFVCSATIAIMAAFDVNFPKALQPNLRLHKVRDVEMSCTIRSKQAFVTCNLAPPLILLMASKMEGSHFSISKKEEEPTIDIVNIDSLTDIVSGGSTSQTLAFSGTDQATSSVPPREVVHRDGGGGDGGREVLDKDCGRERLKRHREEVAGRVMIPDTWGQENLLKDWIDCSTFDELLAAKEISSAREALVAEERRKRSPRLSIASRC